MNIQEVLDAARSASQQAEENPSSADLSYTAAKYWSALADTANALSDVWKLKGAARAQLRDRKGGDSSGL